MTRLEWRRMAESRLRDAAALLNARRWSAAYYLAGYAVECGLKACVVARVRKNIALIFQDRRFSEKCWTHDYNELLVLADLKAHCDADTAVNVDLQDNWKLVKNWRETARYERRSRGEAEKLYQAIIDPANGVLPWIRNHW